MFPVFFRHLRLERFWLFFGKIVEPRETSIEDFTSKKRCDCFWYLSDAKKLSEFNLISDFVETLCNLMGFQKSRKCNINSFPKKLSEKNRGVGSIFSESRCSNADYSAENS